VRSTRRHEEDGFRERMSLTYRHGVDGWVGTRRASRTLFLDLCRLMISTYVELFLVRTSREFSPQTVAVLAALSEEPSHWRHGYALASATGLKSGTLYPILIRLADRGLVEACWQEEPQPGRPRRHLYRLTADGAASAAQALAARPAGGRAASESAPGRRRTDGRGAVAPATS
jgi:DNA-binding PadR family transcriptional regulator